LRNIRYEVWDGRRKWEGQTRDLSRTFSRRRFRVVEGFGQIGEMQADDEAVRSDEGIDFSENESPMQLRKGIGGTGNGQVNGRIGGESDVETFGKARTKVVTVVFGGVRSECGKDGDTKRFRKFPAEFAENG
jgi:hypothetical protein